MVVFLLSVENDRLREENERITSSSKSNEMRFKGVDLVENEIIA